jgi:hypothetical protein
METDVVVIVRQMADVCQPFVNLQTMVNRMLNLKSR